MVKATKLTDLYNVLNPEALTIENMKDFYCGTTMEVRTGDKYESPTLNIFDAICEGDTKKAFLFMGHRGCGKSTELNELNIKLSNKGFMVKTIKTALEIDMQNAAYWDLFFLIGKKIVEMAKDCNCNISEKILKRLEGFWDSVEAESTQSDTREKGASIGIDGEIGTDIKHGIVSYSIDAILKLFGKAQAEIKFSNENRKTIRRKVEQKAAEWIEIINLISDAVSKKCGGKYPVIIFEDLDKLDEEIAWSIFLGYAYAMSKVPVHIIYTFPIGLSYSPKFGSVAPYFRIETLPMIKLHFSNMAPCDRGVDIIKEILFKRVDESLFSKEALREAIISTGGNLRDLFNILLDSSIRANRRNSNEIELEDVNYMLTKLSSVLTRRIESKQYDFLKSIYKGDKTQIKDREMLLQMMQAQVVLEYNGTRWHDLHPLVEKFLKDQELI